MEHIISTPAFEAIHSTANTAISNEKPGIINTFLTWCNNQEDNRMLWLGIALMGNFGMVLPLTLLSVLFASGNNFMLWIIVLTVNMPVLAFNLAAQPTRVTLPTLFTSWLISAAVIIYSLGVGLMS